MERASGRREGNLRREVSVISTFYRPLLAKFNNIRAREDRRRYEAQMAAYQPPEKQRNKKRNKTGYNMFFSAHVLQLKDSEQGVPSERGSVARLVGNAWKVRSSKIL